MSSNPKHETNFRQRKSVEDNRQEQFIIVTPCSSYISDAEKYF